MSLLFHSLAPSLETAEDKFLPNDHEDSELLLIYSVLLFSSSCFFLYNYISRSYLALANIFFLNSSLMFCLKFFILISYFYLSLLKCCYILPLTPGAIFSISCLSFCFSSNSTFEKSIIFLNSYFSCS